MAVDIKKIEDAVRNILVAIGEDPEREGLKDTPNRVARMFEELTEGQDMSSKEPLAKVFCEQTDGVVVEKDIAFSSTCEHHLMPFFGKVNIGYIPCGKVVGLSKLARVVDIFAKRLQLQERMGRQIANAIFEELRPIAVLVAVEAEHTCMTARGVKKQGAKTLTTCFVGDRNDARVAELYALMGL